MVDSRRSEGLPDKIEWRTPLPVFKWIQEYYGIRFDLDPCTARDNHLGTEFFFTKETDGLAHSWRGRKSFVNPPFGREVSRWIDKAISEITNNVDNRATEIVMLLPSATDTLWFKRLSMVADITFITGRIALEDEACNVVGNARGGYLMAYLDTWLSGVSHEFGLVDLLGGKK